MTLVIAHRGASATERENTVEAFRAAGRLGADGVELDLRLSADGHLVVHHDPEVPGLGAIASLRAAQLPGWVPDLGAAVESCAGLQINIELKNLPTDPSFDPDEKLSACLCRFLNERSVDDPGFLERVWISSFSLPSLEAVRAHAPEVRTGWLTLAAYDQSWALATARDGGHWALEPVQEVVDPELVSATHDAGLALVAWTVDDPVRIRSLAQMGVDAVVTNVPDVARAALAR